MNYTRHVVFSMYVRSDGLKNIEGAITTAKINGVDLTKSVCKLQSTRVNKTTKSTNTQVTIKPPTIVIRVGNEKEQKTLSEIWKEAKQKQDELQTLLYNTENNDLRMLDVDGQSNQDIIKEYNKKSTTEVSTHQYNLPDNFTSVETVDSERSREIDDDTF